jgi:hypothetical protein
MNSEQINFKGLCKLYRQYKSAIDNIVKNAYSNPNNSRLCQLNKILRRVEKFQVSWKFYENQSIKFSKEFEDLIIFNS